MNKHQELWQVVKRLEDAKEYVEPAMMSSLENADVEDILLAQNMIEKLIFVFERIKCPRMVV